MANSIDFLLTNAAEELISKVIAGKTLNFTRMAVGDGFSYDTNVAKGFKNVVNEVLSLDITKKETLSPSSIKITSAFKNTDAQKEFYYREVGLYAQDPDTGEEVLYAYGNRNDVAELITPAGSNIVTKQLIFIISVGDSANVTFNVNADVYALQSDMLDVQADIEQIQSDLGQAQTDITTLQTDKANKNLNNTGMITNCLLEVPQRIKYDLTDGVLTIKAGSVFIVPYGVEDLTVTYPVGSTFINDNFKVYDTQYSDGKFFVWAELQNDIVDENEYGSTIAKRIGFINLSSTAFGGTLYCESGTNTVSINNFTIYYNTKTNFVGYAGTSTTINYGNIHSLPYMLFTVALSGNIISSIDQVFNGIGYIGSTVWVDKGVRGLIPNGRNADGTLDNIEYTIDRVRITGAIGTYNRYLLYENGIITGAVNYYEQTDPPTIGEEFERWFDTKNNLCYFHEAGGISWRLGNFSIQGKFSTNNSTITTLEPKTVFRAVDYSDYSKKIADLESRIAALETV